MADVSNSKSWEEWAEQTGGHGLHLVKYFPILKIHQK